MKTLLDVQNEIRDVGQLLSDTARRLDTLSAEVRDLRTSDAGADTNRYDDIRALAKSVPFKNHPLAGVDDHGGSLRRLYLTLLASAVRLCGEDVSLPLAYVQWVLARSRLGMKLEELWTVSAKPERVDYDAARESIRDNLRLCLIVDMLVVAQAGAEDGKTSPAALEYVSSLCAVLGLTWEDVKCCAAAVRVMLCGRDYVDFETANYALRFSALMLYQGQDNNKKAKKNDSESGRMGKRVIACRVLTLSYEHFSWKHENQPHYVHKGEIIAIAASNTPIYSIFKSDPRTQERVYNAPCNGWLFHLELNNVKYGVISFQNDNLNSIRAWVKKEVYK